MKQITIYELLPLLRKGWVAMDKNGEWWWYSAKPDVATELLSTRWHGKCYEVAPLSDSFNIAPFDGDWKDSLMACGKRDTHDKATLKTPIGDIATSVVAPNDVCIAPKVKEFSFTAELINGVKIAFEKIPNNAGLTDKQLKTFFEDLFGVKDIKKITYGACLQ